MAQNYRMIIEYDGSRYSGWARQPGVEWTIQGKLESVLGRMCSDTDDGLQTSVEVIGAGRTDAGVHARGMVANVRLDTEMDCDKIRDYLNRYLPDDICVKQFSEAGDRFHARYNAIGKTYRYTCYLGETKPVFDRKYVYCLDEVPDIEQMKRAAEYLIGEHDFASFCHNPRNKKSTVREVDRIEIKRQGDYLTLTYHGTGFLQYMVRILTGTLLEVGMGKRTAESMAELLEAKKRDLAGFTAPACGLCLMEVDYH